MRTSTTGLLRALSLGALSLGALTLGAGCAGDKPDTAATDADGDGFLSDQDCDDEDPEVHPAADELCDGEDDDCDGEVDEHAQDQLDWYLDADGDSYGVPSAVVTSCEQPDGYAATGWDCDDADEAVFPGGAEVCDGLDNDCDGLVDDADASLSTGTAGVWYRDLDGDGYGDVEDEGTISCEDPSTAYASYVNEATDCDDSTAEVAPDLAEVCGDGLDNDCDGAPGDCAWEGEIALEDADATVLGEGVDQRLGSAAAGAGDLDGDGAGDLWVTSQPYDDLRLVSLLRGPLRGRVSRSEAVASLAAEARSGFGAALIGGRDVDGDGWPDLILGDATAPDEAGDSAGGALTILGPLAGELPADIADATLLGAAGAEAGASLAWLEDRDEDGLPELAVGAPGVSDGAGGVAILGAMAGGSLEGALWLWGEEAGARAGSAVAAQDLDGDGLEELLIGGPASGGGAGALWVWAGPLTAGASLADAPVAWVGAEGAGLGQAVAAAGDTDEDGYGDALISAPGADGEDGADGGAAWLILGGEALPASVDEAGASFAGAAGDLLGASLVGLELSGDEAADLALGAPGYGEGAGRALVFYGDLSGALLAADADLQVLGADAARAGEALCSAGDLNGDGLPELGVGAPGDSRAGSAAGALALFSPLGW